MLKKKEGFTLIELLAVILILGIIALIAVPTVNNVVTSAKKESSKVAAKNIVKAAEQYYALKNLTQGFDNNIVCSYAESDIESCTDLIEVKGGNLPKEGILKITTDGNVNGNLKIDQFDYYICNSEIKENECNYSLNSIVSSYNGNIASCLTSAVSCTEDEIKAGIAVNVSVNKNEKYKFYVVDDQNGELTLIAANNYGGGTNSSTYDQNSSWCINENTIACGGNGYKAALPQNWNYVSNVDLIDAQVIANLSGFEWTAGSTSNFSGTIPSWFGENTGVAYGNLGYWTKNANTTTNATAWIISDMGVLNHVYVGLKNYGIRPVIRISKSN